MDTTNKFLVGLHGNDLVLMRRVPQRLSVDDAMNLAAWLVALADMPEEGGEGGSKFQKLLAAVRSC